MVATFRKAVRHPMRAASRARFLLASATGHTDYVPFIILAHARTGSNMLLSMLRSHPQVLVRGEVFARVEPDAVHATVARTLQGRVPRTIGAAGCKVFYYHPLGDRSGDLWRELDAIPDLHVVHLRRQNVLRTIVSREIADQRDEWLQTRPQEAVPAERKRVAMTVEQVRNGVDRIEGLEREAEQRFANRPLLEVCYEDLVSSTTEQFRRITDFLGVSPSDPMGKTFRQNPEPLAALLVNYDELKSAFRGTNVDTWLDA
jgi:LPS sulfotransferase NodH